MREQLIGLEEDILAEDPSMPTSERRFVGFVSSQGFPIGFPDTLENVEEQAAEIASQNNVSVYIAEVVAVFEPGEPVPATRRAL